MSLSNYPPGQPTGVSYSAAEVTCPNGHRWIQHITYERDVNAWDVADGEEVCPECGEEQDPTEDRPIELDDEDPDAYDKWRERDW